MYLEYYHILNENLLDPHRHFSLDIIKQFRIGYIPSFPLKDLGEQFIPLLKTAQLRYDIG